MYYLIHAETRLPSTMTAAERADLDEREEQAGIHLVGTGRLVHIWRVPGRQANIAIWSCEDADDLHRSLTSLPAWPWMDITVQALATHPLSTTGL
ncbi:MAG TPA: muconolactone Delta-isomerase family protein [Acidothermaceae bacterium]|nr:muconolactone Delta-isomerase family protein [Acidothermaceae bacterium]